MRARDLATEEAVIAYAVGVDIACRMRLSVLDVPVAELKGGAQRPANALERETAFGIGSQLARPADHMGEYAAANHAVIHRRVAKALRATTLPGVENHHNVAWREEHDGRAVIVHRKGATPAGEGVLGVIPGVGGDVRRQIEAAGVTAVMAAQADLVEVVARFDPRIVKMAPSGERPED